MSTEAQQEALRWMKDEIQRLDERAKGFAAEAQARGQLLAQERTKLEAVAQVLDRNGHELCARAIRDATTKGHPDD
jgi:hypothetical protein